MSWFNPTLSLKAKQHFSYQIPNNAYFDKENHDVTF